jgi:hypothetical protein
MQNKHNVITLSVTEWRNYTEIQLGSLFVHVVTEERNGL